MSVIRPKLYKNGIFLKRLAVKQQVIFSPNNNEAVVYRGRAYELFDDSIDISKKSFSIAECSFEEINDKKKDEYLIEKRSFKTLVFLKLSQNKFNSFLYELDLNKIPYIQSGPSSHSSESGQLKKADYYVRFSNEYVEECRDFDKIIDNSFRNSLEGSYKKSVIKEIGKILTSKNKTNKKESILNYINQISLIGLTDLITELYQNKSSDLLENIKIDKKLKDLNQKYLYQIDKIEFLESEIKKQQNDNTILNEINKKDKEILELYEMIDEYESEINQLKTLQISSDKSNNQNKLIGYLNGFLQTFAPSIQLIGNSEINFINKFTKYAEVLNLIKSLNSDFVSIKSKKIQTLFGWYEVNTHISTGNEKKGRIYFKKIKEPEKTLVYIDYKEDDKSQKRVFKYLSKLNLKDKIYF